MKTCFSTLGCMGWDVDTICRNGQAYGFDGVDFRVYLNNPAIMQMLVTNGLATRQQLADAGLEISAISSSINACDPDAHERNLDEARQMISMANLLGTRNVRIFGGGSLERYTRAQLESAGRGCIEEILALDGARDLHWLFETHDQWIQNQKYRALLDAIPAPFGVLWDVGHTTRIGAETPQETIAAVGRRIGYIHLKDAVYDPASPLAMKDGWRYVLPGTGALPLAEAIRLLKQIGYDGWLMFEHEKFFVANLPEPEVAFPAYMRWITRVLVA